MLISLSSKESNQLEGGGGKTGPLYLSYSERSSSGTLEQGYTLPTTTNHGFALNERLAQSLEATSTRHHVPIGEGGKFASEKQDPIKIAAQTSP